MSHQQAREFLRQVLKVPDGGQELSFLDSLNYLIHSGKSGRGAARILGVSESTIRRWRAGIKPKAANTQRLQEKVRELRMRPSAMGDQGVMIHTLSDDRKRGRRERDISGRQLQLRPGTLDRVKAVWITTGDPDSALRAFLAGVGNRWYQRELTPREWREQPRGGGEGVAGPAGAGPSGGAGGGGSAAPTPGGWDEWPEDFDLDWDEALESDYYMSFA